MATWLLPATKRKSHAELATLVNYCWRLARFGYVVSVDEIINTDIKYYETNTRAKGFALQQVEVANLSI